LGKEEVISQKAKSFVAARVFKFDETYYNLEPSKLTQNLKQL